MDTNTNAIENLDESQPWIPQQQTETNNIVSKLNWESQSGQDLSLIKPENDIQTYECSKKRDK